MPIKKKIITAMVVASITLTTASVSMAGGLWSMAKNAGIPVKQSTSFVIEVQGVNIRAYVFDVPEIKSVCISVWGENTQQLECKTYAEMAYKDIAIAE